MANEFQAKPFKTAVIKPEENKSGTILFDGNQIIQNRTVISNALANVKKFGDVIYFSGTEPTPTPGEFVNWYNWTIREFADWSGEDYSHTIPYTLIQTDGHLCRFSTGVLGYSASRDELIGDKYTTYSLSSDWAEEDFHTTTNEERLIIDPNSDQMTIQRFEGDNPTPSIEYVVDLRNEFSNYRKYFYGFKEGEYGYAVCILKLYPDPDPNSAT
ncbi:MAG: hypothetical protein GXY48_00040 [Methanomicrobiales archaeon]|nr:hypothetical protein [Methanomicrobiales archaeon]